MKKYFLLFFLTTLIILSSHINAKGKVYAVTYPYARIPLPNVALYKTPVATDNNIIFYMEQSYYVKLLEDESGGFYKAEYIDEIGYVQKSDLTFIKGTPQNAYPTNISFRVFAPSGLNLRSSPVESEGPFNVITVIPYLENSLMYYGKTIGEEAIIHKGNLWYYAKYLPTGAETTPKGYLYSVFCDLLSVIPINSEQHETIDAPIFETSSPDVDNNLLASLPQYLQIIIILGVCLPCIIIIYFLFKPTKITIDTGKKKKKIRKLKGADYYEFDE